ncbi:hypothetical protein CJO80_27120 (plasmid) [Ralstonia solanacearum]|nr:hypothetical protein CJO80_27120 [Ralstonia solanacearum]
MPLSGNAETFERALRDARKKLVDAKRMRCDNRCDDHIDRVLATLDDLLDRTQSDNAKDGWQQRVDICHASIMAGLLHFIDIECEDCLHATRIALEEAGILR